MNEKEDDNYVSFEYWPRNNGQPVSSVSHPDPDGLHNIIKWVLWKTRQTQ